ncbi:MBL fold metallo-hydrolase [Bacillus sp. MUM 13]|uniref:MBL fold metallo-hydrolase n=1 Tax=Bacillus sp. MUM 13 TaxID=1678001 RepID=UPI000A8649B0
MMAEWIGNIAKLSLPTPYAVGDVNVYVVKGDALTLIDAGSRTGESRSSLIRQLGELRLEMNDIEQVLITHHHPDHAGGLDFFTKDINILGHLYNQRWFEMDEDFIELHDQFYKDFSREMGIPDEMLGYINDYRSADRSITNKKLTSFLAEGDDLPGLRGWKTIETPGHAQSHLSFYKESDGIMIGGDHLLAKITPNPLMEPPFQPGEERPKPLLQYNSSLEKCLELPISLVYTGHGEEIRDVPAVILSGRVRQHERAMKVKKMIEAHPSSGFEICRQLFPKVYQRELGLTLSETVGQLDYLESLGEIEHDTSSGVMIYAINQLQR